MLLSSSRRSSRGDPPLSAVALTAHKCLTNNKQQRPKTDSLASEVTKRASESWRQQHAVRAYTWARSPKGYGCYGAKHWVSLPTP
eukprot:4519451-Prymnesium_polylepis.1